MGGVTLILTIANIYILPTLHWLRFHDSRWLAYNIPESVFLADLVKRLKNDTCFHL